MAHEMIMKGMVSELTVTRALLSNGWIVATPLTQEPYDLLVKEPGAKHFKTVQVKTLRRRTDRDNQLVVYAKNSKGEAYDPDVVDYIAGVEGDDVYMFPCRGHREYWATEKTASKRWLHFTTNEWNEPQQGG